MSVHTYRLVVDAVDMQMRPLLILALLPLAACASSWPSGSYSVLRSDADASVLARPIVDQVEASTEAGQSVCLEGASKDDALGLAVQADLTAAGVPLVERGGAHRIRYVTAPLDQGTLLRVSIDDTYGGAQFFTRDANGTLTAAGPFMEWMPQ